MFCYSAPTLIINQQQACVCHQYICAEQKKDIKHHVFIWRQGVFFYWLLNLGTKNNQIRHRPLMVKYEVLAFNIAL